jgi:hypothetical protein
MLFASSGPVGLGQHLPHIFAANASSVATQPTSRGVSNAVESGRRPSQVPWIGRKKLPDKLPEPHEPKLRRNRRVNADLEPFFPSRKSDCADPPAPAENKGPRQLAARFDCLRKPSNLGMIGRRCRGWISNRGQRRCQYSARTIPERTRPSLSPMHSETWRPLLHKQSLDVVTLD